MAIQSVPSTTPHVLTQITSSEHQGGSRGGACHHCGGEVGSDGYAVTMHDPENDEKGGEAMLHGPATNEIGDDDGFAEAVAHRFRGGYADGGEVDDIDERERHEREIHDRNAAARRKDGLPPLVWDSPTETPQEADMKRQQRKRDAGQLARFGIRR